MEFAFETTLKARRVSKIVAVFDICSSTKIIEDLLLIGHVDIWREFLISIKEYLSRHGSQAGATPYKFVGDGWILLFNSETPLVNILRFLRRFGEWFEGAFTIRIASVIQRAPATTGITFGLDSGEVVEFEMNDTTEYVGRPINVACRLQGATKDTSDDPPYKLLASKHVFGLNQDAFDGYTISNQNVRLSNVLDGTPVDCMMVDLKSYAGNLQYELSPLQNSILACLDKADDNKLSLVTICKSVVERIATIREEIQILQSEKAVVMVRDGYDHLYQLTGHGYSLYHDIPF